MKLRNIAILALIVSSEADAGRRPNHRGSMCPSATTVDFPNDYAIDLTNAATSYVDTPNVAGLNPTTRYAGCVRFAADAEVSTDILLSKDNDSTQRTMGLDLNTCFGGICGVRLYQCQNLTSCGHTRLTDTAFRLANGAGTGYLICFVIDHPLQAGIVYVDGAAVNVTDAGAIDAVAPAASTSAWTAGAKNGGTGAFEADGRMKDIMLWIDPPDPGLNGWSDCFFQLNNRRGSRTMPAACPVPTTWCRGGADNGGTGSTCTNYVNPGTYDWTLHSASYVTNTEITKLPDVPTVAVNNALVQAVPCFPAQSNCEGQAVLADLDTPTPGQIDNYPNYANVLVYGNDRTRWQGNNLPDPVDRSAALTIGAAFVSNSGVFTSETTDLNSSANADVLPFGVAGAVNDFMAIALPIQNTSARFNYLRFDNANGVAGIGGTCAWEYCSAAAGGAGSACTTWTAVSGLSDATVCFTAAVADGRVVTFTHPANWVASTLNSYGPAYFARARLTGTFGTAPVLDQGFSAAQSNIYAQGADATPLLGPMMSMCDQFLNTFTSHVCGLVPTARGGSAMGGPTAADHWTAQQGTAVTRLFGENIHRLDTTEIDSNAEPGFFINYQGEAEINEALPTLGTFPASWHTHNHRYRTVAAIEAARDHLAGQGWPGPRAIPWIITELPATAPTGYDNTLWQEVRTGQSLIPTMTNDAVVVQSPDGPYISAGNVHLGSAAAFSVGRAWADAFLQTRRGQLLTH